MSQDDLRCSDGHKKGGRELKNMNQKEFIRRNARKMISQVGSNILKGKTSVNSIQFPINCNSQSTSLQLCHASSSYFPYYISIALSSDDSIYRFGYVVISILAGLSCVSSFSKPLQPFLGETYQSSYLDGTQLYSEQISSSPPITYFLLSHSKYLYYGYYDCTAKAGMNSLKIMNGGKRVFIFRDSKQRIDFDFCEDLVSSCFIGDMKSEAVGAITFRDEGNGLDCKVQFGNIKGKPSDCLDTWVKQRGEGEGERDRLNIKGSYLGYLYLGGKKVWDYRTVKPFGQEVIGRILWSDSYRREDLQNMMQNQYGKAQHFKQIMEDLDTHNAQLRQPQ